MSQKYPEYPLTQFPNNIDNFSVFLNMSQNDYQLIKQYQEAIQVGNMALAQQIFNQIPQGGQKIITALRFNQLREAILAMEEFYGTDIKPYITTKQTEWQGIVNQFSYKGNFNSTTQYETNNIVQYTYNGLTQLYINIYQGVTPIGIYPINTTYWRVFTIQGQQGESGVGATFAFAWDSSVSYALNTIVVFNNTWWNCTQANQNQQPTEGSDYWQPILYVTQSIYPIQTAQPPSQKTGELWFKVV